MKDKRGFTLIELIAVIVILGLVLLIAIPFFSGSLKTFRSDYYKNLNGNIKNSGQNFFTDNRAFLPHNFLKSQVIDVNTLEEKRYVNPVKDYNGEKCDTKDSYVIAVKLSRDEYAYTTCLKCSSDEYDDSDQSEYCDPAWRDDTGLGYTDVSFVAADDVHVYKGTSRSDLKKLVVAYPTVKRCKGKPGDPCTKESGNLIKEVTAAGEDGIQPIYPMNLDTVDTNRVGVYTVQYKYNDDTPIVTGKVYVYENPAPVVSIKKTNKVLRVNQDQVTGTPHTINPNYDDTNPDDWAQELNFTFKYTFSSDADPRLKVTSYQYKINGRWEDYCTSISGSNGCTKNEIREMNEDVPFRMIDNQGHISAETRAYTLKIDNTKPKCEVYETGTMGDNDWYVSDVTIRFRSKSDQQPNNLLFVGARSPVSGESYSGITTSTILKNTVNYQKTDTNGIIWYGYIEDKANNYTVCHTRQFKRDATAPICELRVPNVDGDNNYFKMSSVKVDFKTHTDTSGQADYSGVRDHGINTWNSGVKVDYQNVDTNTASWTGQIRDNAGNMSTCSISFKKDSTPPTCTAKIPAADGTNGWHKMSTVKVEINTTNDNLSGVRDYGINSWNSGTKVVNHTADTAGITYTYQIRDNAGNMNTCSVWFKKDSTAPTCGVKTSGTTGNNGWYKKGTVSGSFTSANDNLSGVSNYGFDSYSGSRTKSTTTSTSGTTWTGYIKDNAGNTNTCSTSFKFDNASPTCSGSVGGYNSTTGVTFTVSCSDSGGSGCASGAGTYGPFAPTGTSEDHSYRVTDGAGNTSGVCKIHAWGQLQRGSASCNTGKRCPQSSCETAKTCTDSRCGTYSCNCKKESKSGWGIYCDGTVSGIITSGGWFDYTCETCSTCNKTCTSESICGCQTHSQDCSSCGCASWNNPSSWSDDNFCDASEGNCSATRCRWVYRGSA